jgi:pimeloyl-ACP methyl ester carboxylesterase
MIMVKLAITVAVAYALVVLVAWLIQERLAFPAPRAPVPDPRAAGVARGERIELLLDDHTRLAGWFVPPMAPPAGGRGPGLVWCYGNGENIAAIAPVLRDFAPPQAALLVLDYPGYGGSAGRATEAGLYATAEAAYQSLAARRGVDPARVYVYGRSIGSAAAVRLASRHPVAGLVLDSPFTSAWDMSRAHYAILPRFILRLSLDNVRAIAAVRCPALVFHGTADRLAPVEMGRRLAAAAPGGAELVLIEGAGHNETYALGGRSYRERLWRFIK